MSLKNYRLAADIMVSLPPTVQLVSTMLTAHDIGRYGGLCALATYERADLRTKVIENVGFQTFLENLPDVRLAIEDFYHSRYSDCLKRLARMQPDLQLDIYLSRHVAPLLKAIRSRSIVQYFSTYLSADIKRMAGIFLVDVATMEKEIVDLIKTGKLDGKVDSHNKILHANQQEKRKATFEKVIYSTGDNYKRTANALLLRASVFQHDFIVRPTHPKQSGNSSSSSSSSSSRK